MVFDDQDHPRPGDLASGTAVWFADPDLLNVLTWSGYSSPRGSFSATRTEWRVSEEPKDVEFHWLSTHTGDGSWRDDYANVHALIPDSHKRLVREWAREHFGGQRFRRLVV